MCYCAFKGVIVANYKSWAENKKCKCKHLCMWLIWSGTVSPVPDVSLKACHKNRMCNSCNGRRMSCNERKKRHNLIINFLLWWHPNWPATTGRLEIQETKTLSFWLTRLVVPGSTRFSKGLCVQSISAFFFLGDWWYVQGNPNRGQYGFGEKLNRGGSKPGGFPLFSGKVRIVSQTLSGLLLVGAVNRPRKRTRTNRKNPRESANT